MKDFLKQHYEKALLLGLFGIFIALMFMVQGIIESTKEITEDSLQISKPKADYKQIDPNADEFNIEKQKAESRPDWKDAVARNKNSKINGFSDLTYVFPIAECPGCKKNDGSVAYIPLDNFSSKEKSRSCFLCGTHLPAPAERRKARMGIATADDEDGDGISNENETKFGLDPKNPDDALYDNDNDGFSNIFEIENGSDPNDVRNHPDFWWRLRLADIKQVELPVRFMGVNENDSKDKTKWDLQFNVTDRGKVNTVGSMIGDSIEISGRYYKVTDVVRKSEEVTDTKAGGRTRVVDKTKVYLVEEVYGDDGRTPDKLEMQVGKPAYSSDKRPVIEDVGFFPAVEHGLPIGGKLLVSRVDGKGSRRSAKEYQIVGVDVEKMIVKIVDLSESEDDNGNRTIIEIDRKGKIPSDMRVGEKKKESSVEDGE